MPEPVQAPRGERMIEVRVRFFTNKIAEESGFIEPKRGWTRGVVSVKRNPSHGIEPGVDQIKDRVFTTLYEIPGAIERVLVDYGIKLRPGSRQRRILDLPELPEDDLEDDE